MSDNIEERIRIVEVQLARFEASIRSSMLWGGLIGLIVLGWLGYNTYSVIPSAVEKQLGESSAKEVANKLDHLLADAEAKVAKIATLSQSDGTLWINGKCFRPMTLVRCYRQNDNDHFTWMGMESECQSAGYNVEGRRDILASCEG